MIWATKGASKTAQMTTRLKKTVALIQLHKHYSNDKLLPEGEKGNLDKLTDKMTYTDDRMGG